MTEKLEKKISTEKIKMSYMKRFDSRNKNFPINCENHDYVSKLDASMSFRYYEVFS